jgi:hypothetical protein
LFSFNFVDSKKDVAFSIVTPSTANNTENWVSERIAGYFDFCKERKIISRKSPSAKTEVFTEGKVYKNSIFVITGKDRIKTFKNYSLGISMDNNGNIIFKAQDEAEAKRTYKAFGYILDKKFEYEVPFKGVMGLYNNMLAHFKLHGKTLPYIKYFE